MVDLGRIVSEIDSLRDLFSKGEIELSLSEHELLLTASGRLYECLETPSKKAHRYMFALHPVTAIRVATDMGILDLFNERNDSITVDELATKTGANRSLVLRIMRLLVASDIFRQLDKETYTANPVAKSFILSSPESQALIRNHDLQAKILADLPAYLKSIGFQNPSSGTSGPFQYTYQTKLRHFDWLKDQPRHQEAFNNVMSVQRTTEGQKWFDFYPFAEKAGMWASCQSRTAPLLVDVGGGIGTDLQNLMARFPDFGSFHEGFVLQDLPQVIDSAKHRFASVSQGSPTPTLMAHNFLEPQPIPGACFYFLHSILHDWPESDCETILRHLRDAMVVAESDEESGYKSILLLNENIMPDENAPLNSSMVDLTMMIMYAAMERTEEQWEQLLNRTGFELVKVWRSEAVGHNTPLLEAVVKK